MKNLSVMTLFLSIVWAPLAFGQSTPREVIIDNLGLGESVAIFEEGAVTTEPEPDIVIKPENEESDTIIIETEVEKTPIVIEPISKPNIKKPTQKTKPAAQKLTPFYVSAKEYLANRGDSGAAMVLTYDIKTTPLDRPDMATTTAATLIIGQDYVAFKAGNSTRTYDFKLNRLLSISTRAGAEDAALYFDNLSLYAKAYRNLMTAKTASDNGKRATVLVSANSALDVFWIDSAMGFAVRDVGKAVIVETGIDTISAAYENTPIADIKMSDAPYLSEAHKNAFFAFAHYDIALHPLILLPLYEFDTPPNSMDFTMYNPAAPNGINQTWTLTKTDEAVDAFPLPEAAKSVMQRKPVAPLAFVINEAVRGRALGGPPSAADLAQEYDRAFLGGQHLIAWVLGNRYQNQFGACKKTAREAICNADSAIRDLIKAGLLETDRDQDQALIQYIEIIDGLKQPATRAKALRAYQAFDDEQVVPAFVERSVALARAKMKKDAAKVAELDDMDAETMLHKALAQDPYDPHTYLGLAQVLAAKGSFEESWDVYDAMRAGIPGSEALATKINRFENNLEKTAPAFFPPDPN